MRSTFYIVGEIIKSQSKRGFYIADDLNTEIKKNKDRKLDRKSIQRKETGGNDGNKRNV